MDTIMTSEKRFRAKLARRAADKILEDCVDRCGIKHEFRKCEAQVIRKDILPAWRKIIREAIEIAAEPKA